MKRMLMGAIATWIVFTEPGFSNGGTFAVSNVHSNGNLQPVQKSKITLDREDLNVVIKGDYAEVSVEYRLINRGRQEKVLFGFPVDQIPKSMLISDKDGIDGYRIEDNGIALPFESKTEELPQSDMANITEGPYRSSTQRRWFLSEITFARGESKVLRMTYRVRTSGTSTGTSKTAFWTPSERKFSYTFKPAATWGNGKIRELNISLDLRDLEKAEAAMVIPPGFKKEGDFWIKRYEDFDLRNAADLSLTYNHTPRLIHEEVASRLLDRKWIQSIRASSTHPKGKTSNYSVENLLDGNIETAWIEGVPGVGIGEWIEITFKKGVRISAIGMINGYCKSNKQLYENGQMLQCEVQTKGDKFSEDNLISLQRTESTAPLRLFPAAAAQWIYDYGDGSIEVRKVRITITGAEQGHKFADTAISELFICGVPPNEP